MTLDSTPSPYPLAELLRMAASPYCYGEHSPLEQLPYVLIDLNADSTYVDAYQQMQLCGWLQQQPCPTIATGDAQHPLARAFDVLLPDAREIAAIVANICHSPQASMVLVQVLRCTEAMPAAAALLVESLGYATLQTGPEFQRWLASSPQSTRSAPAAIDTTEPPLLMQRHDDELALCLNRPAQRNAFSAEMRDALYEALQFALSDDSIHRVTVRGNGACFSIGGALDEFGSVANAIGAHTIRSLRLPANLMVQCCERLEFHLHSACIGAGMEIPAFGRRVTATRNAFFQLPELRFGLIPGAGGCVSVPRRIGRQRTAYLALSMKKLNASTALAWGLIDAIVD